MTNTKQKTYTLHEMREKSGVTGATAAKACGTTYTSLRNWEKGNTIPNIIHICILLNLYGYTIDQLDISPFQAKHQHHINKQKAFDLDILNTARNAYHE